MDHGLPVPRFSSVELRASSNDCMFQTQRRKVLTCRAISIVKGLIANQISGSHSNGYTVMKQHHARARKPMSGTSSVCGVLRNEEGERRCPSLQFIQTHTTSPTLSHSRTHTHTHMIKYKGRRGARKH